MTRFLIPLVTAALFAATAFPVSAQGGSGGGGSSGGGGGTPNTVPQIAGAWHGQEHYDPSLSVFLLPAFMNPALSMTLNEDVAGNLTGIDDIMHVAMTGKASANGSIVLQDGVYYGQKLTGSITGSVICSDGSPGTAMSGKFQRKEGLGTFAVDTCPAL
jgi:hypothetical protein